MRRLATLGLLIALVAISLAAAPADPKPVATATVTATPTAACELCMPTLAPPPTIDWAPTYTAMADSWPASITVNDISGLGLYVSLAFLEWSGLPTAVYGDGQRVHLVIDCAPEVCAAWRVIFREMGYVVP